MQFFLVNYDLQMYGIFVWNTPGSKMKRNFARLKRYWQNGGALAPNNPH